MPATTALVHGSCAESSSADLPAGKATLIAIAQRPIAEAGLGEPSGPDPLWKHIPGWFTFGNADLNIPVGAHRAMAERANSKRTMKIAGVARVVGMSDPSETAELIAEASAASQP